MLYWKLLYEAGYTVVLFDTGFRISECHVCRFQAGALCDEICTTKATREQEQEFEMQSKEREKTVGIKRKSLIATILRLG